MYVSVWYDINKGRLDFNSLNNLEKANVCAYPYEEGDQLMHHKFCVIDRSTVITGSYNWSFRAQENEENITVITATYFIILLNRWVCL